MKPTNMLLLCVVLYATYQEKSSCVANSIMDFMMTNVQNTQDRIHKYLQAQLNQAHRVSQSVMKQHYSAAQIPLVQFGEIKHPIVQNVPYPIFPDITQLTHRDGIYRGNSHSVVTGYDGNGIPYYVEIENTIANNHLIHIERNFNRTTNRVDETVVTVDLTNPNAEPVVQKVSL